MIKSRIGKVIDQSPYKNEYIREYMNVSANTLSNWRTGKSYPSLQTAYKLSKLLGVKIDDLIEGVEE